MEGLDFTFERRLELTARDSREEGREDTIFSLVSEKDISVVRGAEKLQLSVEEFGLFYCLFFEKEVIYR